VASIQVIQQAVGHIPADDRDVWLKIGMALKSELGDEGFGLWDYWSQSAHNYNERDARVVWRSIKRGPIGIGTLFHVAKDYGWGVSSNLKPIPIITPKAATKPTGGTKKYALELWLRSDYRGVETHPYAIAKGIDWSAGAKRGKVSGCVIGKDQDCVIVPIRDLCTDKVVGVQCINPKGDKQTFGSLSGNGFICGNTLNRNLRWFVVEGWADAISMVFHHYQGNAMAFAACGKSSMDTLANRVAEVFKPDKVIILEDAA